MNWKTEGFSEAGIGVRNPDGWIDFLRKIGGWRVIHQGETAAASVAAWPRMEGAEVHTRVQRLESAVMSLNVRGLIPILHRIHSIISMCILKMQTLFLCLSNGVILC